MAERRPAVCFNACVALGALTAAIGFASSHPFLHDAFCDHEMCSDSAAAPQTELERAVVEVVRSNRSAAALWALFDGVEEPSARRRIANLVTEHRSVLFLACHNQSPELVAALVHAGADPAVGRLDEGTTPLHLAAGWLYHPEIVDVLLGAEWTEGYSARLATSLLAKPSSGGLRGHTSAWWAKFYGHIDTWSKIVLWAIEQRLVYDVENDEYVELETSAPKARQRATSGRRYQG